MQLLPPVRRYLINRHINVPDDWLTACIEWALQEYSQKNVPFIQEQVYQEWLHADLAVLETKCLAPDIKDQPCITITGHFPLQINSVRDVSEPAYAQLLKVEGADTENTTVSATQDHRTQTQVAREKADRMLMLELTDGTLVLEGMEYQPIPNLSVNLSPGTKVLVYGSVQVRHGILLLKHNNVSVLGGKVVDLLKKNDQKNILTAALNTPDTDPQPQHRRNNDDIQPVSRPNNTRGETRGTGPQNSTAPPTTQEEEFDFSDDEIFESGFDQEIVLENESIQDQAVYNEFSEDLALENEFDEGMDAFMSQL